MKRSTKESTARETKDIREEDLKPQKAPRTEHEN